MTLSDVDIRRVQKQGIIDGVHLTHPGIQIFLKVHILNNVLILHQWNGRSSLAR